MLRMFHIKTLSKQGYYVVPQSCSLCVLVASTLMAFLMVIFMECLVFCHLKQYKTRAHPSAPLICEAGHCPAAKAIHIESPTESGTRLAYVHIAVINQGHLRDHRDSFSKTTISLGLVFCLAVFVESKKILTK